MTMKQHYYTSCRKGHSGSSGFQVKAMSPGIDESELKALNSILNYRIPPSLDTMAIDQHPVALRYKYLNRKTCILLCSQSSGSDEGGRPGNFFTHSVLTSPTDFEVFAPIMYWRHKFWLTRDDTPRLEIPVRPAFDLEPSLDFEAVWPFLSSGNRRDWFYKLLCATLYCDQDNRRVVILDDIDNIALWIAATTFALPSTFRQFLSFATYHHDPYQAPFIITGTTKDSRFRFSSDEFISFFVLDAAQNRISDTQDSSYARFVCQHYTANGYVQKLVDFFQFCSERLPRPSPQHLASKLDAVCDFYLAVRERSLALGHAGARASLEDFLEHVEKTADLSREDLADLISTADLYRDGLSTSPSSPFFPQYARALRMLKTHDPKFVQRCKSDLQLATDYILQGSAILPDRLVPLLNRLYSPRTLSQVVNRSEFLDNLDNNLPGNSWSAHFLLWKHLGPLFHHDAAIGLRVQALIHKTLALVESLPTQGDPSVPPDQAQQLFTAMGTSEQRKKALLDSAVSWKKRSPGPAFAWAYDSVIGPLPLDDRGAYRNHIVLQAPEIGVADLIRIELGRDIRQTSLGKLIPLLETWVHHTREKAELQTQVASQGLRLFWARASSSQRYLLAERALASRKLSPHLDDRTTKTLLSYYLTDFELKSLDRQAIGLVERFAARSDLKPDQRAAMEGALALSLGYFRERSTPRIRQWLSKMDPRQYAEAAEQLVARFFRPGASTEMHIDMLQATYAHNHHQDFWTIYWDHFRTMLLDPGRVDQALRILSFWFDDSLPVLSDQRYLGPTFFLQLPGILEEVSQSKEFKRSALLFKQEAHRFAWYPLIQEFLTVDKRRLSRLFGR